MHVDNPFKSPAVLSICPGFLGLERGIERAIGKIRVIAYVEIEAFIVANLLAGMEAGMVDACPIWTDVKTFDAKPFHKKIHGIMGGYPCFQSGTLVLTYEGYTPIEEIKIGDRVLTHKGRWRKVTAVMQKDNAELQRICSQGSPNIITTPEHPFYARKKIIKWNNARRTDERLFGELSWIKAKELSNHYTSQILPQSRTFYYSPDIWWVVGRYLADGWVQKSPSHKNKGRVNICCNRNEADFLEFKLRSAGFNPTRSEERTTTRFAITRIWFYEFLLQFGRYSHGKKLPGFALELNTQCSAALLEGYLSGDGTYNRDGSRRATSVSKKLAYSMALLAQRAFGIIATLRKQEVKKTKTIQGRRITQRDYYVIDFPLRNTSAYIDGEYGHKLVRKCEPAGTGTVYNIAVEEDESYMVENCIVHNCQPFSTAGQRRGHEDPRHLWPSIQGIIKTTQPIWCFFENVAGHLSMGYGEVYRDLQDLGYSVEPGIFTAEEVGAPHERKRLFIMAISTRFLQHRRKQFAKWVTEFTDGSIKTRSMANASGLSNGRIGGSFYESTSEVERNENKREWRRDGFEYCGTDREKHMAHPACPGQQEQRNNAIQAGQKNGRTCHTSSVLSNAGGTNVQGGNRLQESAGVTKFTNSDCWPAGPGQEQYRWEHPRTIEPRVGSSINGYNFREDLLRAYGNSVVEQTAEIAFLNLLDKHLRNLK